MVVRNGFCTSTRQRAAGAAHLSDPHRVRMGGVMDDNLPKSADDSRTVWRQEALAAGDLVAEKSERRRAQEKETAAQQLDRRINQLEGMISETEDRVAQLRVNTSVLNYPAIHQAETQVAVLEGKLARLLTVQIAQQRSATRGG